MNPLSNPFFPRHLTRFATLSLGLTFAWSMQSLHADTTWTGGASQDWNNVANWSNGLPLDASANGAAIIDTASGNYPVYSSGTTVTDWDIIIGSTTGQTGRLDQTAGTLSSGPGNWLIMGAGGTGTLNLSGGTLNTGELHMARTGGSGTATVNVGGTGTLNTTGAIIVSDGQNNVAAAQGTLNVNSGGTVNSENDLVVSFAGGSSTFGEVNIAAGGIVNVGTTTERWMIMNTWDTAQGRLNVNGGTLVLNANTDIRFSTGGWGPGSSVGTSSINLNSGAINGGGGSVIDLNNNADNAVNNSLSLNGGTLTIGQIVSGKANGSRVVNFNGGTLKAAANSAAFFASGAASAANVQAGGAKIDSNGFNVTIGQALLNGGGGGGLTKQGSGTLTLSGSNTYTGTTSIQGGTLALDSTGTINNTSGVSLGTGGTFDVSAKSGYTVSNLTGSGNVVGALTVSTELAIGNSPGTVNFSSDFTLASAATYSYEFNGGGNTADLGDVAGSLILTGSTLDLIQLGTYTINDKFTLFAYDGALTGLFKDTNNTTLADGATFTDGGGVWKIDYNDPTAGLNGGVSASNTYVTITAVPEPSAAMLVGGLGLLGLYRRRRV